MNLTLRSDKNICGIKVVQKHLNLIALVLLRLASKKLTLFHKTELLTLSKTRVSTIKKTLN